MQNYLLYDQKNFNNGILCTFSLWSFYLKFHMPILLQETEYTAK